MLLAKHFVSTMKQLVPRTRTMATQVGPLVDLSIDNDGIAILTMNRPPVNSLNLELLQEISKSLDEVAKNKTKGMILTSSSPSIFSAGLDIMEMYKPDLKRAEIFWTTLQDVWIKLFGSSYITAAAINDDKQAYSPPDVKRISGSLDLPFYVVEPRCSYIIVVPLMGRLDQDRTMLSQNTSVKKQLNAAVFHMGHAPAGGCLLSMSCEYRVMVGGKYAIGLNETALGIVAPTWFMDTMCHTIPIRQAEYALTTARMFTVDEALQVGLIDESASDKADAIDKCKKFIRKFDKIPSLARAVTKQKIREGPLVRLQNNRQQDTAEFLGFIKNPKIQQSLEMYIQSLKQKAAK